MNAYVEHVNLTVKNLESAVLFISTAMPEFQVRHQGTDTKRWCHIGTDSSYLAIQEREPKSKPHVVRTPYFDVGVNHIGLVVDNVEEVAQRLTVAGYRKNMERREAFRKRIYFYDDDGIEWEFIEYLTRNSQQRNHYEAT